MEREIVERIRRAVEEYNRFRSPEAHASIIAMKDDKVTIRFDGSFCETCGIRDWVEDMVYVLEDHGIDAELIAYIEPPNPDENYRIGVFKIKGLKKDEKQ